ncbi:LysR family transcriptional regulator [Aquabacter spiritensis]|uniref:DNA-binding transcriptional LysR family regulator n=1 Tax=Aquabacter spiritensis TaxID=933073 RepID=A0A4R3M5X2_9HYPH|nr:LysR family transcriptional regulator [Aquabacter spiritensis]TCT07659.1 DNA-binding transcriptional LysR family regulator [Aquabacter spiritensis]
MNITLRQLRAFVLVVERGSFTKAASDMHLTQSALSLLVRDLEAAIGARLIDRTTRSASATAVGLDFFASARRILDDLDHAVGHLDTLFAKQRGRVVVAAPLILAATFLPPILAGFRDAFPGIDLVLCDTLPNEVLPLVRAGTADLGIGTFRRGDDDVTKVLLFRESMVAVHPRGHALGHLDTLRWADLDNVPVLTVPRGSVFRELAETGFAAAGLSLEPAFEATYVGTLLGLVGAGLGVAIVPGYATALADTARVGWRRLEAPVVEREVVCAHRAGFSLSPAAEAFKQHVLETVRRTWSGAPQG